MIEKKVNRLSIFFFENLLRYPRIGHFVSTRAGGNSGPPFESLNLGFGVGDDQGAVVRNRTLLAEAVGISTQGLTMARQVHGARVDVVSRESRGRGAIDSRGEIDEADAMVTDVEDICLVVLLADCVPVIFYDTRKNVIGIAHAGWKGTVQRISEKTVTALEDRFGSAPHDIIVGIGPSAGPCCYEVGPEVASEVERVFGNRAGCLRNDDAGDKHYLDLWRANMAQLVQSGIPEENIEVAKICTCHHNDVFYSFRADKGKTGRFGAGIVMLGA